MALDKDRPSSGDSQPLLAKQRIDQVCLAFEDAWQSGERPRLAEYLLRLAKPERPALLQELLLLEVHYRRETGETPTPQEYQQQFPDHARLIAGVFERKTPGGVLTETADAAVDKEASTDLTTLVGAVVRGTKLGRFELIAELGEGGFGKVYRARDPRLDRDVALKIPRVVRLGDKEQIDRFLRGARAAGQLRHPNIVPVHETGKIDDTLYIVSEFVAGRTLREELEAGRKFTHREAAKLVAALASALHYAHAKQVVHRDIKPENIMLDANGEPQIMDFGLARREEQDVLRTREGLRMGTLPYMSPEQASGQSHLADARSDLWSLGVVLYELLAGKRPFSGSEAQLLRAIQEKEPAAARMHDRSIPRDLETVCLKCLRKEPQRRYQTCQGLADELNRWLRGEPIEARPVTRSERAWRWARRNPAIAALATVFVISLLTGTVGSTFLAIDAHTHFVQAERSRRDEQVARRDAEQAQKKERQARLLAEQRRAKAEEVQRKEQTARRDAEQAQKKERQARLLAEHRRAEAEEAQRQEQAARREAEERFEEARRLYVTSLVAEGEKRVERNDLFGALLWFAEALRVDEGHPVREPVHRRRLAAVMQQCPNLARIISGEEGGPVRAADFRPDGRQFVLAGCGLAVYDAKTGRRVRRIERGIKPEITRVDFSPAGRRLVTVANYLPVQDATKLFLDPKRIRDPVLRQKMQDPTTNPREMLTDEMQRRFLDSFNPPGPFELAQALKKRSRLRVFDVATWQHLPNTLETDDELRSMAWGPDEESIVVETASHTFVWEFATGRRLPTRPEPKEALQKPSSKGGRLGVMKDPLDGSITFFDEAERRALTPMLRHCRPIVQAVVSSDRRSLVTVGGEGTARLWHLRPPTPLFTVSDMFVSRFVQAISKAPRLVGGLRVESSEEEDYTVAFESATGVPVFLYPLPHGVNGLVYSADGKRFATIEYVQARVWDARTAKPLTPPLEHGKRIGHLQFSPDGSLLVTASEDRTARVWDVGTGNPLTGPLTHAYEVNHASFSPDGKRVATASVDGTTRVWNARTGEPVTPPLRQPGSVLYVWFTPNGRRLLTVSSRQGPCLWDIETGQLLVKGSSFSLSNAVHLAAVSPDRESVFMVGEKAGLPPYRWDTTTEKSERTDFRGLRELFDQPHRLRERQLSSIGRVTSTGSQDFSHHGTVTCLAFSTDGKYVVSASEDKTARIWSASQGLPLGAPMRHRDVVTCAEVGSKSEVVATASKDGTARVWDVRTGAPVTPEMKHPDTVVQVVFHPWGHRLATVDAMGSVRFWNVAPDLRSVADLVNLTQVLSGRRIDVSGNVVPNVQYLETQAYENLRPYQGELVSPRMNPNQVELERLGGRVIVWQNRVVAAAFLCDCRGYEWAIDDPDNLDTGPSDVGDVQLNDSTMRCFRNLSDLRSLIIWNRPVGDAGLQCLQGLANLEILCLNSTRVTGEGFAHIAQLGNLKELGLWGTKVGDDGLAHLVHLKNLSSLNLNDTGVTDDGLKHLRGMTNLRSLSLKNTSVTAAGIRELRRTLPELHVEW